MAQFGKYELHEVIGKGGFGTVYRATDTTLERVVAVKVLHPAMAVDPDFIERFRREAKFSARLKHPHIVQIYDLAQSKGSFYIAMDYLPGGSLKDLLVEQGGLPYQRALQILGQAASALDYAHGQGVVHRDLKPGNLLFDAKGNLHISDFGFAKAFSGSGSSSLSFSGSSMVGTPPYMPPELWTGEAVTPATDVYSLACVFYEMFNGTPLFTGDSPPIVMARHFQPLGKLNLPAGCPPGLGEVFAKALARDPKERYATCGELVKALEEKPQIIEAVQPVVEERQLVEETLSNDLVQPVETANFVIPEFESVKEQPIIDIAPPIAEPQPLIEEVQIPTAIQKKKAPARLWIIAGGILVSLVVIGALIRSAQQAAYDASISGNQATLAPTLALSVPTQAPSIATIVPTAPIIQPTMAPSPTTAALELPSCTQGGKQWISPVDGMALVCVAAGEFTMGSTTGQDDEKPVHTVYLDAYWIDQTEVTNEMFEKFVQSTGYQTTAEQEGWSIVITGSDWQQVNGANWQHPAGPNSDLSGLGSHPVVDVSWNDATAYCSWARRELPTEAQWEKAARSDDQRIYPWGNEFDCKKTNGSGDSCDGYATTAPVGSYSSGASPYGALDMSGNVWEWVADWYGETYYSSYPENGWPDNPTGPATEEYSVLRGGSWNGNDGYLRSSARDWIYAFIRGSDGGFRCARGTSP